MNLDDAQKQKVAAWIAEGLKIADIQKRLDSELGVKLTYLEVRLLMTELSLMPQDPAPPKPAAADPLKPSAAPPTPPTAPPPEEDLLPPGDEDPALPAGPSKVAVTVDHLARPGAITSGKVTFSDGKSADWYLDQMGRLGLAAKEKGYRPPAADVQEFQMALERELRKLGM